MFQESQAIFAKAKEKNWKGGYYDPNEEEKNEPENLISEQNIEENENSLIESSSEDNSESECSREKSKISSDESCASSSKSIETLHISSSAENDLTSDEVNTIKLKKFKNIICLIRMIFLRMIFFLMKKNLKSDVNDVLRSELSWNLSA